MKTKKICLPEKFIKFQKLFTQNDPAGYTKRRAF